MSTTFSDFDLSPQILQAILSVGYETPSPIQAASLPPLLEGKDILGQAQTGTGKTAAFSLPLLSRIDISSNTPQILVLTPTRELCIQVAEAMQNYASGLKGFHILPIYGGQQMGQQVRALKRGVHVIVATPGRMLDHISRKTINLKSIAAVVLDEADEMLRMGFIDDVDEILTHTPKEKQVALFSATMPSSIRNIAMRHLNEPVEIKIESKTSTVESINQRFWLAKGTNKLDALTRILEAEEYDAVIIFVRTKNSTVELAQKLSARGYSSSALNGDLNQQQREQTVGQLKSGDLDIVIATDVVARGLDVPRISMVINYDIPYDNESYVHRIGRTGRAGRSGEAILFVAPREKRLLNSLEKSTGQAITQMHLPTREAISEKRTRFFKQTLLDTIESNDLSFFKQLLSDTVKESEASEEDLAAAMAYLLQADMPLQPQFKDEGREPMDRSYSDRDDRSRGRRDRDRGDRGDRGSRGAKRGSQMVNGVALKTYRIEVGEQNNVSKKHIVGAIANEIELDSQYIGNIELRHNFSLVDLPAEMPKELFNHLKKVRVCGRPLAISVDSGPKGGGKSGGKSGGKGGFKGDFKGGKQKSDFGNDSPRRKGTAKGRKKHDS